jgi:TPR repeat protein
MLLRFLIALVLSLVYLAAPAWADHSAGEDAYYRGDYATAFRELTPLAESGDVFSEYILGLMYVKGEGGPQDFKQAEYWFFLAAEQGHAQAQDNLGVMYANGLGVPLDFKEAVRWYRLAAEQGEARAQSNLGLMYAKGEGVSQDYELAHMWFNLAAVQGEKIAADLRDSLAKKMTPAQIAEAQKLASEWKPRDK